MGHPLLIALKMTWISSAKPFGITCSRPISYCCHVGEYCSSLPNLGGTFSIPLITISKFSPSPLGKGIHKEMILFYFPFPFTFWLKACDQKWKHLDLQQTTTTKRVLYLWYGPVFCYTRQSHQLFSLLSPFHFKRVSMEKNHTLRACKAL